MALLLFLITFISEIDEHNLDASSGFKIIGTSSYRFGNSVDMVGDFNGDGVVDFVIGSSHWWTIPDPKDPEYDIVVNGNGRSYVLFGAETISDISLTTSISHDSGFFVDGLSLGDQLGKTVKGIGDINGDGLSDVLIGSPGNNTSYIIFGSHLNFSSEFDLNSLNGSNGFLINHYSDAVDGNNDLNQDGIDDLILGTSVIFGSVNGFGTTFDITSINGTNGFNIIIGENITHINFIGDINGDGLTDFALATEESIYPTGSNLEREGAVYIIFGSTDGYLLNLNVEAHINQGKGFYISGTDFFQVLGLGFDGIGDFNSDGIDDFAISERDYRDRNYIVFGGQEFGERFLLQDLNGSNGFYFHADGRHISSIGDINNDGADDFSICDETHNPVSLQSGICHTLLGQHQDSFVLNLYDTDLDGNNGFSVVGDNYLGRLGSSISGGADINNDGIDDLIIGAAGTSYINSYRGELYVIFGQQGDDRIFYDGFDHESNQSKIQKLQSN